MNDQETEKELLENGFTQGDVNFMRKIISRGENSEETLLMLTHTLKSRFHTGCFLCVVLITILITTLIIKYDIIVISVYFSFTLIFVFLVYYITPMKLAYKSYSYLKRKSKMG
ncbi:hypothetical protein JV33_09280 [Pectobacterium carotovorum subsp. carotovorum]|nr:hypothetical protein JV33_09280 [Pectobacterium carotovorum subsp. carotovorum]KML71260.1 hypothetical protein G032_05145 [Pectobacterium carotovorum subsp. carotovorum ICMP 5702]SHG59564.1 hypothetical protein SAMN05444147_103237 [Pectobacterium carotovorum]